MIPLFQWLFYLGFAIAYTAVIGQVGYEMGKKYTATPPVERHIITNYKFGTDEADAGVGRALSGGHGYIIDPRTGFPEGKTHWDKDGNELNAAGKIIRRVRKREKK